MAECKHENFVANVDIMPAVEEAGSLLACVRVRCAQCDLPFQFVPSFGELKLDDEELRVPIRPKAGIA